MRQSNSTSKIVVGIALAVVFAIGVSIFAIRVRQMQEGQLALNSGSSAASQSANQDAADAMPPAQQSPAPLQPEQPTGQSPGQPSAPAADAAAVAPATNSADDAAAPRKPTLANRTNRANRETGSARSGSGVDRTDTRVASVAGSDAPAADERVPQTPQSTVPDAAVSRDPAGASGEQADPDSRITAAVKSQIDQAAPDNNVMVTTSNGVVALAGSLPSGDVVQLATQAASRVPGVKSVDSSALEVSKQ